MHQIADRVRLTHWPNSLTTKPRLDARRAMGNPLEDHVHFEQRRKTLWRPGGCRGHRPRCPCRNHSCSDRRERFRQIDSAPPVAGLKQRGDFRRLSSRVGLHAGALASPPRASIHKPPARDRRSDFRRRVAIPVSRTALNRDGPARTEPRSSRAKRAKCPVQSPRSRARRVAA